MDSSASGHKDDESDDEALLFSIRAAGVDGASAKECVRSVIEEEEK